MTNINTDTGGDPTAPAATRQIHDVNVQPLHGDAFLNGHGIGAIDFDGPTVSQLRCGVFAQIAPLPRVNERYVITGTYDDAPQTDFSYTLVCSVAARPPSTFTR